MNEKKMEILNNMISNGYHATEDDIKRFCQTFSVEQLQKMEKRFLKWKEEV